MPKMPKSVKCSKRGRECQPVSSSRSIPRPDFLEVHLTALVLATGLGLGLGVGVALVLGATLVTASFSSCEEMWGCMAIFSPALSSLGGGQGSSDSSSVYNK